jgi:four helix bundle protein
LFFYEKWDVFKVAVRLREISRELSRFQTPGTASDLDHLRRAASSGVFNIAEGAKERHPGKKLDRYGTAQASASECNAVLLVLEADMPAEAQALIAEGRELADRESAMLTNLIRSTERNARKNNESTRSRRKRSCE